MTVVKIKEKAKNATEFLVEQKGETLGESVRHALKNYFSQLKGEEPKGVYQMVLAEVEVPLLEIVMKRTKGNQSLTTRMLGLSRGTVREKLKIYEML